MFKRLILCLLSVHVWTVVKGDMNDTCNCCTCNADAVGGVLGFIIILLLVALVICCLLLMYPRWIRPHLHNVQYLTRYTMCST